MKKVLVIGLGKSGLSALQLLTEQGKEAIGYDDAHAQNPDIEWTQIAQVVVSPGVPPDHFLYEKAVSLQIEVIGEAELALRSIKQRAVAITGTNGKTTVTLLTEHILKTAGIPARAVGNVGEPLSALRGSPEEVLVVELSSFQIETLRTRAFDAAVLLNITPDHLDRYTDMRAYAHAKCALEQCLKEGAPFFVQDAVLQTYGDLFTQPVQQMPVLILPDMARHDRENALAAYALCRCFGVSEASFLRALWTFEKPAHRIEFVSEIDGICYYDDSKGTNVDAVIQAVYAMRGPVILIVGGVDKGASYLPWAIFKEKVKQILALGQAAKKIAEELEPFFALQVVSSLREAVERARHIAVSGDTVLLSPGCSSYDMFRDYVQRGEEFKRYVKGYV